MTERERGLLVRFKIYRAVSVFSRHSEKQPSGLLGCFVESPTTEKQLSIKALRARRVKRTVWWTVRRNLGEQFIIATRGDTTASVPVTFFRLGVHRNQLPQWQIFRAFRRVSASRMPDTPSQPLDKNHQKICSLRRFASLTRQKSPSSRQTTDAVRPRTAREFTDEIVDFWQSKIIAFGVRQARFFLRLKKVVVLLTAASKTTSLNLTY